MSQFYIPVEDKVTPALGNLQRSILGASQIRSESLAREQEQKRKQDLESTIGEFQSAFDANDYDTINRLSVQYPDIGKSTLDLLGAKNDRTKQNAVDTLFQLNTNPSNFEEILSQREQLVVGEGGNPIDTQEFLKLYRENPEEAHKKARGYFAQVADKETYDRYKDLTTEKATEYTNIKKEPDGSYVGFNTGTGQIETIPGNYKRQATQTDKKLKEVKGGVKYYEDGSEEPIGQGEQVKNPITGKSMNAAQAESVLSGAKEFQLKNAGFAVTLDSGLNTIDSMYEQGYDPSSAAWVQQVFGDGSLPARALMSEDDQTFFGSVDQMINAIARRETGAAITEFERKDFFDRYMPRAGDKPKRIKQKRNSLERQLKSIAGQSGGAFEALTITGADAPAAPSQEPMEEAATVIMTHPNFGDVTEQDIQQTMRDNNMTREQVMQRLGG